MVQFTYAVTYIDHNSILSNIINLLSKYLSNTYYVHDPLPDAERYIQT